MRRTKSGIARSERQCKYLSDAVKVDTFPLRIEGDDILIWPETRKVEFHSMGSVPLSYLSF